MHRRNSGTCSRGADNFLDQGAYVRDRVVFFITGAAPLETARLVVFVLGAFCCVLLDVMVGLDIHSDWGGVSVALVVLLMVVSFFAVSLAMFVSKSVRAEYGVDRSMAFCPHRRAALGVLHRRTTSAYHIGVPH
jgi:hypothetical protein